MTRLAAVRLSLLLAVAPGLSGCVHAVAQGDLSRFAEAAGKVHDQADVAFARANAISRHAAIDVFVASRRVGLSDRAFPPVLDADTIAAWDAALTNLERYGSLLAELTDAGRGARAGLGVTTFGHELQSGQAGAGLTPGIGAGFAALAGILVDSSAQSSAKAVMRRADPEVRRLLVAMAKAVGSDRTEGLQGTVWSNWTASLNGTRAAYAVAAEKGDEARQRSLIADYLGGVDKRSADLRALSALHVSLLALADAHAAAAAGSAPTQAAIIAGMERRLGDTRRDIKTLGGGA